MDGNWGRTCNWLRREAQVVREGEKEGGVAAIVVKKRNPSRDRESEEMMNQKRRAF